LEVLLRRIAFWRMMKQDRVLISLWLEMVHLEKIRLFQDMAVWNLKIIGLLLKEVRVILMSKSTMLKILYKGD